MTVIDAHGETSAGADAAVFGLIDADGSRLLYRLLRLLAMPALRLLFRIEVRGRENLPTTGAFVVAANHLGWLDAPLLVIAFPRAPRINFVADATFVSDSTFRWFMARQMGGVLPLVTHGHGVPPASRVIQACLGKGGSVGFFPEGRYAVSETELPRFHRGFAKAAIEAHVPVVPVRVSGTKELWLRKKVCVDIAASIHPDGHTPDTLAFTAHDLVASMPPVAVTQSGRRPLRRLLTRLFP